MVPDLNQRIKAVPQHLIRVLLYKHQAHKGRKKRFCRITNTLVHFASFHTIVSHPTCRKRRKKGYAILTK